MLLQRPIRTRFRYGFPTRVNLATHRKLAGSFFKRHAVTRHQASLMSDAPTACRHTVSGTISLRSRGTFHHSLTVLSAIGHQGIFRLSGWSRQIHTEFQEFRVTWENTRQSHTYVYGALTLYGATFQRPSTSICDFLLPHPPADGHECSHNPPCATPAGYHTHTVWPHPVSLATTPGITVVFSS